MLTKIFIKNLCIPVVVGHVAPERHAPQTIRFNIAVWADIDKSITSHDLADTIDYVVIQKNIRSLVSGKEYILIETLASEILDVCMQDARVVKAWLSLEKPHKFPDSESVGIEVERTR